MRCGSAPTWSRGSRCCSTSGSATSAWAAARRRSRRVRRSACGSRPSCARGSSASSTCSTSRPPACTRPTPSRCSTCSTRSRPRATRSSSSSTTSTSCAGPTGSSTSARAPGRAAVGCSTAARSRAWRRSRSRSPASTSSAARQPPRRTAARPARAGCTCAGSRRHNLDDSRSTCPLGVLTAVTGVSGSGKSTLVTQVLAELVRRHLGPGAGRAETTTALEIDVDDATGPRVASTGWCASTSGRSAARRAPTSRRTPACSTRCASCSPRPTRRARAATAPGRFSFNVAEGRCETCQGEGFVAVELLFLPGTYAPCPTCHGARYNAETLEVDLPRQEHRRRARP